MKECYLIPQTEYDSQEIARKIRDYINPNGCTNIFIKPNMVIDPWKSEMDNWISTVTNPAIVEAVIIVLKEKMNGVGCISIGDAPMARSNHERTLKLLKIESIIKSYRSETFKINLIDIRDWYWKYIGEMCVSRKRLSGDPLGNTIINLKEASCFHGRVGTDFAAYDNAHPVSEFHNEIDNKYSISTTLIRADMVINLPKLKTHRIAGMTCAMKNLVGINSNKNCVPHNTVGAVSEGGDACPDSEASAVNESKGIGGFVRRALRKKNPIINYLFVPVKLVYDKIAPNKGKIGWGMWYGNDTIWRSINDLNKIIFYADKNGVMQEGIQRKYICITDAIISGEGEGPLHPNPINTGLILISENPVVNDSVACELMGFDYKKIPTIYNAYKKKCKYPLVNFDYNDIVVCCGDKKIPVNQTRTEFSFDFEPSYGWKNHIERR